jgi:hypothetical protein
MLGEMWKKNYMRIVQLLDDGVILEDVEERKIVFVRDLSSVIQFEIDGNWRNYQPHTHYNVIPLRD